MGHSPGRTVAACVLCSVAVWLFSLLSTPLPGVNETHYLGKALHYWTPEWCANDLLLESQNAHTVFFATLGAATRWVSLDASAMLGRLVGLATLTLGWVLLGGRLYRSRAAGTLGLAIYASYTLAVQIVPWLSLSGEWVIGGIEGKVLAWGFGLAAIRFALDRSWIPFGILVGLATSFHPVVGAWLALCVVGGEAISLLRGDAPWSVNGRSLIVGAVLSLLTAAPGLVPAFRMIQSAPEVPIELQDDLRDANHMRERADYVQVFGRLKHHLDPMEFKPQTWCLYGFLIAGWLWTAGSRTNAAGSDEAHRRLKYILVVAIGIAIAAVFIGYGPRPASRMNGYAWRARFLKLYPFRIADALLPMLLCLRLAAAVCLRIQRTDLRTEDEQNAGRSDKTAFILVGSAWVLLLATTIAMGRSVRHDEDWIAVCRWVRDSTPPGAVCLTPRESIDFKWFAERAEFVNYKDCPQDAAGILEWNRRLFVIRDWRQQSIEDDDSYSPADLARLANATGVTHLVTHRIGPIEVQPVFRNGTYRVYDLRGLTKKTRAL